MVLLRNDFKKILAYSSTLIRSTASPERIRKLRDFAKLYGKAVCQRSTRTCPTKANTGTLPESCYANAIEVSDKSLLLLSQQDSNTASDDDDDQDDEVVEFDSYSSDAGVTKKELHIYSEIQTSLVLPKKFYFWPEEGPGLGDQYV